MLDLWREQVPAEKAHFRELSGLPWDWAQTLPAGRHVVGSPLEANVTASTFPSSSSMVFLKISIGINPIYPFFLPENELLNHEGFSSKFYKSILSIANEKLNLEEYHSFILVNLFLKCR